MDVNGCDGRERMRLAVGDDPVRGDLADAGQCVELLDRGGVEVEGRARLAWNAGRRARASAASGRGPGRGDRLSMARNADLLAVDDPARQVDRLELGSGRRAARRLDGVHDPASGRKPDESRMADPSHHVHGDLASGLAGSAGSGGAAVTAGRHPWQRLGAGGARRRG